jgi:hypothetical protein
MAGAGPVVLTEDLVHDKLKGEPGVFLRLFVSAADYEGEGEKDACETN